MTAGPPHADLVQLTAQVREMLGSTVELGPGCYEHTDEHGAVYWVHILEHSPERNPTHFYAIETRHWNPKARVWTEWQPGGYGRWVSAELPECHRMAARVNAYLGTRKAARRGAQGAAGRFNRIHSKGEARIVEFFARVAR